MIAKTQAYWPPSTAFPGPLVGARSASIHTRIDMGVSMPQAVA